MQYNRTGIPEVETQHANHNLHDSDTHKSTNLASILRLFLAIMLFVVIVLTIAR